MKAAIITCHNAHNYGARLQAYALAHFLNESGHETQVIDYVPDYMMFNTSRWYRPRPSIREWAKLFLRYRRRCNIIKKFQQLEDFSNKYLPRTQRYTALTQLRETPPDADIYITGSDQVWNTIFPTGRDEAFYLDFGKPATRRISYAASFGTSDIPAEMTKKIKGLLAGLNEVSVRESSGKQIVESLGLEAQQVCDPALLLSREQWDNIADTAAGKKDNYLLIYDFEASEEVKAVAKKVAKAKGLKIFSVSPLSLSFADRNYPTCSPSTFVGLIRNAQCVISNSLHGSIFSMIYDVDFLIVRRSDGLNARMADMTAKYGIADRIVGPDTSLETLTAKIDYQKIRPLLQSDIKESKDWLLSQFSKSKQKP